MEINSLKTVESVVEYNINDFMPFTHAQRNFAYFVCLGYSQLRTEMPRH